MDFFPIINRERERAANEVHTLFWWQSIFIRVSGRSSACSFVDSPVFWGYLEQCLPHNNV